MEIDEWVHAGADGTSVFWLHGPAGAGKSAVAQTVVETYTGRSQLAASFLFARTAAHHNEAMYLFPTIAVQVALSALQKRQRLDKILNSDPSLLAGPRALSQTLLLTKLWMSLIPRARATHHRRQRRSTIVRDLASRPNQNAGEARLAGRRSCHNSAKQVSSQKKIGLHKSL